MLHPDAAPESSLPDAAIPMPMLPLPRTVTSANTTYAVFAASSMPSPDAVNRLSPFRSEAGFASVPKLPPLGWPFEFAA